MEFKDDEIKRLQLAAEAEEKKRFLKNVGSLDKIIEETPEPTIVPPSPEQAPEESSLKQIRTYQGDIATALKEQKESLVSIQKRQATKNAEIEAETKNPTDHHIFKTVGLIFGILLFLSLAGVGGYYSYNEYKTKTALPVVVTPLNRFLPIKEERNINTLSLNRETFINLIRDEAAKPVSEEDKGEVVQFELRKGEGETAPLLTTSEFLVLLETSPSGSLLRSFNPLFMLGVLEEDTPKPFILIKLDSFEQAYPGMLDWENSLENDLLPVFLANNGTTTSNMAFEDLTISNKDTRVLRDSSKKTLLLYTFIDNDLLLITDNEETLKPLLGLISRAKLSR